MVFALWVTGLPGSGKSTIAKKVGRLLKKNKIPVVVLRLDEIRRQFVPRPRFTEKEREYV